MRTANKACFAFHQTPMPASRKRQTTLREELSGRVVGKMN
jgi:hypothetical protein